MYSASTKIVLLIALAVLAGVIISRYMQKEGYAFNRRKHPGMRIRLKDDYDTYDDAEHFTPADTVEEPPTAAVPPRHILPLLEIPTPGRVSKTDLILNAQSLPDDGVGAAPVANAFMGYFRDRRQTDKRVKDMIAGF